MEINLPNLILFAIVFCSGWVLSNWWGRSREEEYIQTSEEFEQNLERTLNINSISRDSGEHE